MIVTSGLPHQVALPHEPGQAIGVRRLSRLELIEARKVHARRFFDGLREAGDDVMRMLAAAHKATEPAAESAPVPEGAAVPPPVSDTAAGSPPAVATAATEPPKPPHPLDDCDEQTVLHTAIVEWTYPEPVTPAAIDQLDEPTVDAVLAALRELHAPPGEANRKNS